MTIAVFKKITLFGTANQSKENILAELQSMGCMHLISINPNKVEGLTSPATTLLDQIKKALFILKWMRNLMLIKL